MVAAAGVRASRRFLEFFAKIRRATSRRSPAAYYPCALMKSRAPRNLVVSTLANLDARLSWMDGNSGQIVFSDAAHSFQ
jgi:hypothetical protein